MFSTDCEKKSLNFDLPYASQVVTCQGHNMDYRNFFGYERIARI